MFGLAEVLRGGRLVPAKRKGSWTTKFTPHGANKGKGVTPVGIHTKRGLYLVDPNKKLNIEMPDLTDFELKPYVSWTVPKLKYKAKLAQQQQLQPAEKETST
ncbi:putative mitochondrial ribosomal protein L41 precursor [Planoprotostelium fungivorum]|uniref:Putative mitochondrial ribosomal protein L41 n=1 Tax=Planoprotostelium fungivorum TaxID=1890364 RepID=A0A2P6P044_9EUKA|nr:putative mitochondrial ribosomal protein L41 precursor [Planoprotostelium fungivorum]